jgi:type I restriction enzyme S subunit
MTDEFPGGWATAPLEDIAEINPRHLKDIDDAMAVTFIPMAAISQDSPEFAFTEERPLGAVRKGFTQFAEGDVLFAKITPCMENGKGAIARNLRNGLGCGTTEVHVIRPLGGIDSRYIYRFLSQWSVRRLAMENFTGTAGQLRVPTEFMKQLSLPLAPLAEQERIVASLEDILAKAHTCHERLNNISGLLRRFRQSVLAAACSGRLTSDWRETNIESESGRVLLARIKAKRLKMAESPKELRRVSDAFDDVFLGLSDAELGVEGVPNSWIACRVGAIGTVVNGSTPSRTQDNYWSGTIPWVSSGEVRNNLISSTRERITKSGFDSCSVRLLPPGTVLLAMIGEGKTRGQSAILEIEATINQNVAAIVVSHGLVDPEFAWRWFQFQYEKTRERGSGSGPAGAELSASPRDPFRSPTTCRAKRNHSPRE